MHMLRADAPHFISFGEIYFSCVEPGAIKGWRRHSRMVQNLAVPVGRIQLVMYDDRPDTATRGEIQELIIGPDVNYALASIPPGVWNAFKGISDVTSVVANCATIVHDPSESETRPLSDPPVVFAW
ncbi:MAG: hypothetical protein ACXWKC_17160 [Xanthobacteraceae bacterium]